MSDMDVPESSAATTTDSPVQSVDPSTLDLDSTDELERQIEADASLVPQRASVLLVEPSVLERAELEALLADLGPELAAAAIEFDALHLGTGATTGLSGASYE